MGGAFNKFIQWAFVASPIIFSTTHKASQFEIGVMILFALIVYSMTAFVKFELPYIRHNFGVIMGLAAAGFFMSGFSSIVGMSCALLICWLITTELIATRIGEIDLINPALILFLICLSTYALEILGFSFFTGRSESYEPGGIMQNAPQLGILLCILMPFLMKRRMVHACIALFLGGWIKELGVVMSFFVCLYYFRFSWFFSALVGTSLALLFYIPDIVQSFRVRISVWWPTVEQIVKAPLFGYGAGTFDSVSSQFIPGYFHASNAFSSFLQALFSFGLGIAWVVNRIFQQILNGRATPEKVALLILFILCFFEYPLEIIKLWPLYAIIAGVFIAQQERRIEYES